MGTINRVIIINFYENENNKINNEIIQEFKYDEFYAMNEKLNNGLLFLGEIMDFLNFMIKIKNFSKK